MHRLRSTWFALIGGLLLLGLSVSSVFAARPAGTEDGTRGQTIAAFVHELVFGSTDAEEQAPDEEELEDEELEDEELEDEQEDASEPEDETTEAVEESDTDPSSHGQCVAEEASDRSDEDYSADPEFTNHGAFVSEAARVTCWQIDDAEATGEEDAVLDSGAEITSPDEAETAELSAKEQRKADRDAARADRKAAKASNAGGNGHGRGGGRP